jgi:hypothetical protein
VSGESLDTLWDAWQRLKYVACQRNVFFSSRVDGARTKAESMRATRIEGCRYKTLAADGESSRVYCMQMTRTVILSHIA